jgi:hypothetical protein
VPPFLAHLDDGPTSLLWYGIRDLSLLLYPVPCIGGTPPDLISAHAPLLRCLGGPFSSAARVRFPLILTLCGRANRDTTPRHRRTYAIVDEIITVRPNAQDCRHGNRYIDSQRCINPTCQCIKHEGVGRKEAICMIRKETCPNCKGNRYISVESPAGAEKHTKCPHCDGNGYRIRIGLVHNASER